MNFDILKSGTDLNVNLASHIFFYHFDTLNSSQQKNYESRRPGERENLLGITYTVKDSLESIHLTHFKQHILTS